MKYNTGALEREREREKLQKLLLEEEGNLEKQKKLFDKEKTQKKEIDVYLIQKIISSYHSQLEELNKSEKKENNKIKAQIASAKRKAGLGFGACLLGVGILGKIVYDKMTSADI